MWWPRLPPWEVALRTAFIYVFILLLFRLVGRKELSRYSTFNMAVLFLISVATRQTFVDDDPSLTSAMVALGTLFGLDYLLSWLVFRSRRLANLLEGPVRQLVKDGAPVTRQLIHCRITKAELEAELRRNGHKSLAEVEAAFLERSGRITFIFRAPPPERR
jgi:uncharacterized membrane protein YcaP (DUF421 family)